MLPRSLLRWLHLVVGLVAALFLIALGGSGGLLVFEDQIDHWLNASLWRVQPQTSRLPLSELSARIEKAHPGARVTSIALTGEPDLADRVTLKGGAPAPLSLTVDPYTGKELGPLSSANTFTRQLHQFHTNLLLGPNGKTITAWGAGLLLVLAVTGLILWWPARLWRWPSMSSPRRFNFELHSALGFYSSVFLLFFGVTGLVIHWDNEARDLVDRWAGAKAITPPSQIAPAPAGSRPLNPDEALKIALETAPGARVTTIQGLGNLRAPLRITMRFPEDGTPAGRTNLYLHPATGAVLAQELSRTASPGVRVVKLWNREVHTGDLWGWPTKLLACAASLAVPLLALTGPLIALGNLRRARARRPKAE